MPQAPDHAHKELCKAYQLAFGSGPGRMVFDDLTDSYQNQSTYQPGKPTEDMLIREGERRVVLRILHYIQEARSLDNKKSKTGYRGQTTADTSEEGDDDN